MKATPFLEQILHLVTLFLQKAGHQKPAAILQKEYSLPSWVEHNNPLFKKGLIKLVKDHVKNNPKLLQYYQTRTPESEDEDEVLKAESSNPKKKQKEKRAASSSPSMKLRSPKVTHPKSPKTSLNVSSPLPNSSSWISKFQKPKKLEDIDHTITPQENKHVVKEDHKKHQATKKAQKQVESSEYDSEEDSFELEPKKKNKKDIKVEKNQTKKQEKAKVEAKSSARIEVEQTQQAGRQPPNPIRNGKKHQGPLRFFSRINPDEVGPIKQELRDNSFHSKAKYGQAADQWGQHGYQRLKDTRGDSFKKTKGKLKNKAFQGALMDINKINSIPIL